MTGQFFYSLGKWVVLFGFFWWLGVTDARAQTTLQYRLTDIKVTGSTYCPGNPASYTIKHCPSSSDYNCYTYFPASSTLPTGTASINTAIYRTIILQSSIYSSSSNCPNPEVVSSYIDLDYIPLGVYYPIHAFSNGTVTGNILLEVPTPSLALYGTTPTNYCPNVPIWLEAKINRPNNGAVNFYWQYKFKDESTWKSLTNYNSYTQGIINFTYSSIPAIRQRMEASPINTELQVRVMASGPDASSSYSTPVSVSLSPAAPTINQTTDIITTPSCPGNPTGSITISNIAYSGNIRYILRTGYGNKTLCDPDGATCFSGSSGAGQNTIVISNLLANGYTLWLTNAGDDAGVCATYCDVTVHQIPALTLNPPVTTNLTCNNASNGKITLSSTGGSAPITYQVQQGTYIATKTSATSGSSMLFDNLPAGTYQVTVTDACSQSVPLQSITIKQPAKLALTPTASPTLCTSPSDGQVQAEVKVSASSFDIAPSGRYDYEVRKGSNLVITASNQASLTWGASSLVAGTDYSIRVKDNAASDWCSGDTQAFTIKAAPAIPIPMVEQKNGTCAGKNDGSITLRGMGKTEKYRYQLTRSSDGLVVAATDTLINGIPAGTYQLVIKRLTTTCTDSQTYGTAIKVTEPLALTLVPKVTAISCFGEGDGSIQLSSNGGTNPKAFFYRKQGDLTWISVSSTMVTELDKGSYQVRVVDNNTCEVISGALTVIEPTPLQLTSAQAKDSQCYGENGFIKMTASGGRLPYKFEYALDGQNSYVAFTETTALAPGNYRVRVRDSTNCQVDYPASFSITTPADQLDFSYVLSDYNGYTISCFNGNNGSATLTATGGNGGAYQGYSYSIDNGAFQSNPIITGIVAGKHTLTVKDGRGCSVTKTVTFTQTTDRITLQLVRKVNVMCASDKTGLLEVKALGGLTPYEYQIGATTPFQTSAVFSGLEAGSYQITVKDRNGCTTSLTESISNQFPAMQVTPTLYPVHCFGGQDGRIDVAVSGGSAPYQYDWVDLKQTTKDVIGLRAGIYTLRIKDNAGCSKEIVIQLTEPASALTCRVQSTPVCYATTTGKIRLFARGGTAPYAYSVDNGKTFQPDSLFTTVGVGTYQIQVKDSQGCLMTSSTTVEQRNDKPEPDFIIASSQGSMDTLVIREISVPKPDSISWTFDTAAEIIDTNRWNPRIKFNQPGQYTVAMTGFFGGCSYTLSRQLIIAVGGPSVPVMPGAKAITSFEVLPNPSDGEFQINAKLSRKQQVVLVITDVKGLELYRKKWTNVQEITERITLPDAPSGTYLVRFITDNDAREIRLIINK